jgi:protein-L-isoaspartate(D-aspartate) O-methyltransferase
MERHRPLFVEARNRLAELKLTNVTLRLGDGFSGWPEAAPFDRIIITCQADKVPDALIQNLKPDGVLIAPIGPPGKEFLTKLIKKGDVIHTEQLISVRFVPMIPGIENA